MGEELVLGSGNGPQPLRTQVVALWGVAVVWLGSMAWCAQLLLSGETARRDPLYVPAGLFVCALTGLVFMLWRWHRHTHEHLAREARFRTLVQTARDLIWAVDADGRWTFVNEAARRIYGYPPEEMIGRKYTDFLAPGQAEKDRKVFEQILKGDTLHHETVHVRRNGRKAVLLYSATVMRDARGRVLGTMGTATDVTYRRKMQQSLLLNERLRAVATLGGGFAHDFNNLLTVIIGQAEVAQKKKDIPLQLERRIHRILETAERARKLTQQLVAFARRQPLKKEVIDLVAVVRRMRDLMGGLAGDDVRVVDVLPDDAIRVRADWAQLEQIIMNLVLNARDAIPQGGSVTIEVMRRIFDKEEASVLGLKTREWAVLEVTDDGSGMDEATRDRIFEPFFTTKEPGKGTGLGLATVHGVVHQHGGRITVKSAPGEGTIIRVMLPVAAERAETRELEPAGVA